MNLLISLNEFIATHKGTFRRCLRDERYMYIGLEKYGEKMYLELPERKPKKKKFKLWKVTQFTKV